jgi:hypothetical protein
VTAVDPYGVLGVGPDATDDEVRAAYRRLAWRFHPDKGATDPARMAEVNVAWRLLRDRSADGHGSIDVTGADTGTGPPVSGRLLVLIAAAVLLAVTVLLLVVLIGFGRVGVSK